MYVRYAAAIALALVAWLAPGRALAWQEAHQIGQEARLRVEANGTASVEVRLRWHVVHGPFRAIDLGNIDPAAVLEPDVPINTDDGRELVGRVSRRDERAIRISVDDPHPLMRGNVTLAVRWSVDLAAARALVRDETAWRLTWSAPVAADGIDGARTALDLPAAPDAPQPIIAETGAVDEGAVATLRREAGRDVIELVRPHVTRGEAAVWTVRLDPRAMTQVLDPGLRPVPEKRTPPEPDRVHEASLAAVLGALALAFGLLVAGKARAFAKTCLDRGARPRSLLPLPDSARAWLGGLALAAGVGFELAGAPTTGAACIALATFAASLRAPAAKCAVRGPGRWLALRPEDAFAGFAGAPPQPARFLDASTGAGRITALLVAALLVAAALVANRFDAAGPWLVALDASPLVPVFLTGTVSQLPPVGGPSASTWMAGVFRRLRSVQSLRVAPWARLADQTLIPDELRLLVLPRAAMPGLVGVEVGLAWSSTPVGWTARPEVLARVIDGTAAAAKLTSELPAARLIPGRRADERVAVLTPRSPTRSGGIALARALARTLTDRRVSFPAKAWTAPERRAPESRPTDQTAGARRAA
jgi:hypothetical protein